MTHSKPTVPPRWGLAWGVRLICALALIMIGFAHKPPASNHPVFNLAELAAYTLPDGTIPTLCITVTDDDHTDHHQHDGHLAKGCEACRIAAAAALPSPSDHAHAGIVRSFTAVAIPAYAQPSLHRILPPNQGPRAPPTEMSA
ncbi:hypothetical protein N7E02_15485 [Aliirhizobium terrae]|uniref:hypothetical protein n=1 Tax=Terrirhizobium terrae TaxID=2926709 RepID=UPI0025770C51|nr:hypothetical protein [Rhizobium sp. CC-CFT758]WJH41689.1 hypothetical protein N7E02_15485 [Rhizobium sp. CC-CFT758]